MPAWLKALILWFGILALAVLNGTLREMLLIPVFGSFAGLIASGVILAICIFVATWLAVPWWGSCSAGQWWRIGAFWLLLTLMFEFGFGLAQHKTWAELLAAYTFTGGNIWPLVLVQTLISPRLAAGARGAVRAAAGRPPAV